MPIKINADMNTVTQNANKLYTPKFFSKDITGSGKATGLINQTMYPVNIPPKHPENGCQAAPHWHIRTDINKYVKTTTYPFNPLGPYTPVCVYDAVNFDTSWCQLSGYSNSSITFASPVNSVQSLTYYAALIPVSISIIEPIANAAANTNTTNNIQTGKKCEILYDLQFITVHTEQNGDKKCFINEHIYTENPRVSFSAWTGSYNNIADVAAFDDYLDKYDLHHEICKLSEIWQTTLIDVITKAYDAYTAAQQHYMNNYSFNVDIDTFPLGHIIRYIAQYKVSLPQYKDLYAALKQRLMPDDLKTFTKMNTSLLLQDTLSNLSQINFPVLPPPGSCPGKQLDLSWCSKEQFDAITSASPLNLVQAGAGTGKSTVIKSRLDYLDYLGMDMKKVMVLSFTNAAADNIKARCPGIQSMTIAKMIDAIYQKNHPNHQLSSSLSRRGEGSTFTNSLDMYIGTMPCVEELIDAVDGVEKRNDYATLLRLVESNYDDIIRILDTIGQTTFQLEIIICYLEHATMTIPFDIEHLLIDEVQDNAIFEFVFFLNLTCKLKNHLYLVGDCSQTLYEFRASDPKALNAIENAGLFATFPLNVNYRSNQDVLQFANALLDDIEANQYANIQLQSFKLNPVTKQSFSENVIVDYNKLGKVSELKDWVCRKLHSPEVINWIKDKFAKNEQICVLAYKRREAAMFQEELEKIFPTKSFVSIIPVKNTSFAYFSRYVSGCRHQLLALPTTNAKDLCTRVRDDIITNLGNCHITPTMKNYNNIVATIQRMLYEWESKNIVIMQEIIDKYNKNYITLDEFANLVGNNLIEFEIQKNALRQTLLSQKNAAKKEDTSNADFIFSTIHSAKGLEFDNVLLLYQNKNQMEEDAKRMYYVALTRAKKSEYILAYDTVLTSLILTRYEAVMQRLPDANKSAVVVAAPCMAATTVNSSSDNNDGDSGAMAPF